jgi:hypothetical protein
VAGVAGVYKHDSFFEFEEEPFPFPEPGITLLAAIIALVAVIIATSTLGTR